MKFEEGKLYQSIHDRRIESVIGKPGKNKTGVDPGDTAMFIGELAHGEGKYLRFLVGESIMYVSGRSPVAMSPQLYFKKV